MVVFPTPPADQIRPSEQYLDNKPFPDVTTTILLKDRVCLQEMVRIKEILNISLLTRFDLPVKLCWSAKEICVMKKVERNEDFILLE